MKQKGIFCLEGLWEKDLRDKSSVYPALELLERRAQIPLIHRDCAIKDELFFYLKKWTARKYADYKILYLAFHGQKNLIDLSDGEVTLDDLAEVLEGKCSNRIILFGSCEVFDVDKRHLKRFLNKTNALAILGYKSNVDWMMSTAFELLLLYYVQDNQYDGRGIGSMAAKLNELAKESFPKLKFRMVTKYDKD